MKKGGISAYIVWLTGSLFYLYEYFVRVIPGVIETDLEKIYSANASQVGMMVGMYLLIYSLMQVVVGPLFDVFGSRKPFLLASVILTFSCLLLLLPIHSLACLGIGRFLMGFASAFGFVGVMYLCTIWFHRKNLGLLSGLTTALGLIGAVAAQISLSWISENCGYRCVWMISFGFGMFTTLMLIIFIPNNPDWLPKPKSKHVWKQCKDNLIFVARRWHTWNIGLIAGALYMPLAVFADFWGIPYFTKVCHFSTTEAPQLTSILNLSWCLGGPLVGWISDVFQSRKVPLFLSGLLSAFVFVALLMFPDMSFGLTAFVLVILGICSSGQVISFITCAELNPSRMNASSIAFVNMIIMVVCGIAQTLVGCVITRFVGNNSETFAYQMGLSLIAIALFVTAIIFVVSFNGKVKKEIE